MEEVGLPFIREHRFHPVRRWRFDYYFPSLNIAFEYDGLGLGHTGIAGVLRDTDKINEAQAMGIAVYRANARTVRSGVAANLVERVTKQGGTAHELPRKGRGNRKVQHNQAGKGRSKTQAKQR